MQRRTMLEKVALTILCLVKLTRACWNGSEISLGWTDLSVYDVAVEAESILKGPLYQMGNFDECVYIRKRQYCIVNVFLYASENASSFWQEKKKLSSLAMNVRRDRLFVGLCVPESCNSTQTQVAMFNKLKPAADRFSINATVLLDPHNCQDSHKPRVFADYLMGVIILIIVILMSAGSIYEYRCNSQNLEKKTHSQVGQVLLCFSVINNWKRLCTVTSTPRTKPLRCIQGIRFFTSYFVIAGHEGFGMMAGPKINPEWIEKSYSEVGRMLFVNGHLVTCSFLVISGFMLAYQGMEIFDKRGFNLCSCLKYVGYRYIRLTPALAVVVIFTAGWMNHLGSGPLWPEWVKNEVDYCSQHGWINLLYLNNYVFADQMCLLQTWYLAVDFQSFVVFFLLLGLISKYKLWINVTFATILAICIFIPLMQTYMEELDPTFLTYTEHMLNLSSDRTYMRNYITFHHSAGAYFVGVIFGYIFYRKSVNCSKVSKFTVAVMWAVSLTLPWTVMLLGYFFYQPSYKYNVAVASIYAGLNKTVFGAGIATIVLLCSTGYGGVVNQILSWKLLQVLGRLTYSIYLIHPLVLRAEYASLKQNIQLSDYLLVSKSITHMLFTILFSVVLCLSVEMPISALYKLASASNNKGNLILMQEKHVISMPLSDKTVEAEEQNQKQEERQLQNARL